MKTTVEADVDGLIVVISPEMLDQAELQIGDDVEFLVENGALIIELCDYGLASPRFPIRTPPSGNEGA